uniref:Uncharacterized protein n=1 Tax=Prymnesium polylepis TaxID=72548 RepID=A0A7S4I8S5_9EUKA
MLSVPECRRRDHRVRAAADDARHVDRHADPYRHFPEQPNADLAAARSGSTPPHLHTHTDPRTTTHRHTPPRTATHRLTHSGSPAVRCFRRTHTHIHAPPRTPTRPLPPTHLTHSASIRRAPPRANADVRGDNRVHNRTMELSLARCRFFGVLCELHL